MKRTLRTDWGELNDSQKLFILAYVAMGLLMSWYITFAVVPVSPAAG